MGHRGRLGGTSFLLLAAATLGASGAGIWACSSDDPSAAQPGEGDGGTDDGGLPGSESGSATDAPGGGDGGDAAAPTTPKEACEAYLRAACARLAECNGASPAACLSYIRFCPEYLFAPGSTRGVDDTLACAAVRATQDCDEITRGIDPPCATPGTRQGGEACFFNGQCASERCTGFGTCGTCFSLHTGPGCPAAGEACGQNKQCTSPDAGCEPIPTPARLTPGAACALDAGTDASVCPSDHPCSATAAAAPSGTCATTLPANGPCLFRVGAATATLCQYGTSCLRVDPGLPGGECVGGGVKDDLCGPAYGGRSCAEGFFCTDPNNKGTCQPLHKQNETCSATTQCETTLYCLRTSSSLGTCVPRLGLGEDCATRFTDGGLPDTPACGGGATCLTHYNDAGLPESRCTKQGARGDSCGAAFESCSSGLDCIGGTCDFPACPPLDAGPG